MTRDAGHTILDGDLDLSRLVEHSLAVQADESLETVYGAFQIHEQEFVAVLESRRYVGMISRARVGFLLGARFGFALYAKQPVSVHLMVGALAISLKSGLLTVLNETLSRTGNSFNDDVALLDEAGNYVGMIRARRLIGIQSDIVAEQSRRTLAQQAELEEKNKQIFRSLHELRQSQGRYEALMKNSALGIALLKDDGMVEVCNPRTEALIGSMAVDGDVRSNLADWIMPGHREAFLELLRQHEAQGGDLLSCEREFMVRTANRGERLLRFFTTWIVETGQVCVQFHDVTEQRAIERQMALNEKSALFESLVGGIAHELNNKLSPVLGFADLLHDKLGKSATDGEATEYCSMILDSATEAAKIVRQLLQLSRPAAVEMTPCDLGELISDAGNMLSYRLRETGTELRVDPPIRPVIAMGDASQLKQVLINLMINAVDAMEHAPVRSLRLTVRDEDDMAIVLVADTGHGIPGEHLSRIFNPFFTTKAPSRGTGLGLCVCLSIVRQHKGEITVDSTVGVGTRFRVRLPLVPAGGTSTLGVSSKYGRCAPVSPALPQGRLRVMIVDDEQYITALVQETLRRAMGWHVERAHNGRYAVERLKCEDFDLLISDVRMPEMDGLALYQWVREHRPALASRILFVTGDAGSAELTQALHNLGRPVLYKPFTTHMLIDHCQRLAPA